MPQSLTGTRIRETRRRLGLSQSALAEQAGISPSYLNLIEHNKRGIAGRVLIALARELGVTPADLAEDADAQLIATLSEAAPTPETPVTEFVGRFPDWSKLLAQTYRRSRDQAALIETLSDRLTHDPFLSESIHQMLSNITAIRSTASILVSIDDIEPDQQSRFQSAIHQESRTLSDAAQSLVEYFDRSAVEGIQSATPEEELDQFLAQNPSVPSLDATNATKADIEPLLTLQSAAKPAAQRALETYLSDAKTLPLAEFTQAAADAAYNPATLATKFNTDIHTIFRRLTTLTNAPKFGRFTVNAAGHPLARHPLPNFPLPRHSSTCPEWPIYQAFAQPNRPHQDLIEPTTGSQFVTLTVAQPTNAASFTTPTYHSSMLFLPRLEAEKHLPWLPEMQPREVGTNCRITPCRVCAAP